jgi:hypothetical protein
MATNLDELFNNPPDWAQQAREEYARKRAARDNSSLRTEALAQSAIADAAASLGRDLLPEEEVEVYNAINEGRDFNLRDSTGPDFSNVEAASDTVANDPSFWEQRADELLTQGSELGSIVDTIGAGVQRTAAGLSEQGARLAGASGTMTGTAAAAGLQEAARRFRSEAEEVQPQTEKLQAELERRGGVQGFVGGGLLDAAQSPTSILSLVGGPAGAVAVADAYASAYKQGADSGLRGAELEAWAWSQAAPESIAFIPAGKLVEKIPVIGPLIKKRVADIAEGMVAKMTNPGIAAALRLAKTATGETIEETATGSMQDLAAAAFAGQQEAAGLQRIGQAAMPQDEEGNFSMGEFLARRGREARAAIVTAGAAGPIIAAQEQARFDQAKSNEIDVTTAAAVGAEQAHRQEEEAKLDAALEAAAARVRERNTVTRTNEAYDALEAQEAAQRDLEQEAGFRTIEANKNLGSRVDRFGDAVVERTPIQPVEITPEQVEAERTRVAEEAAQKAEQERIRRAAAVLEPVRKEMQTAAKRSEAAKKAAETNRRKTLAAQVLRDNPNATPEEQTRLLAERLDQPVQEQADPIEKKVQGVINQIEGLRKRRASTNDRRKISQLVRQNPEAKASEIAEQLRAAQAPIQTTAQLEEDTAPAEADLRQQYAALRSTGSLNMEMDNKGQKQTVPTAIPADRTPEQQKGYETKVRDTVSALSKANTNQTADVQNLMRQGKLVVTDTPETVGRQSDTAAAQYDIGEGKMYLYLDRINPKDAGATVMTALHEATHGGQFNDRQGRPDIYTHMMGKDGVAAANGKIRRAAKEGNKLAQRAVDKANDENVELVPYFVSEAVKARGTSLGRLGGIVRDLKSSAKRFARENLGQDLDFSLDDLESAAQRVGQEIVQTDLRGREGGESVDMIGGRGAMQFDTARATGSTFRGRVDNKERFEIPDTASVLTEDKATLDDLVDGKSVPLGELLGHEELYKNYPVLKDVRVKAKDLKGARGSWDAKNATIEIAPWIALKELSGTSTGGLESLHSVLLHETQHAIQTMEGFVPGTAQYAFIDPELKKELDLSNERFDNSLKNFEIGPAVASLSPADAGAWRQTLNRAGNPTDPNKVKTAFLNGKFGEGSTRADVRAQQAKFLDIKAKQNAAAKAFNDANDEAFLTYLRDYGEAEARNTQYRALMDEAARLDTMPEETMGRGPGDRGITVDQTVDTRPLLNPRALAANRTQSLDMAAETTPQAVPRARLTTSERVKRVVAHGQRERIADIKVAEDLDTRFQTALKLDTGSTVLTEETNKMILDALSSADNNTPEGRAAVIAELRKKLPKTATVIQEARDRITDGTIEILDNIMGSGRPLSAQERKHVSTLMANLNTYLTRSYAAFQQGIGRKWAEGRWSNYRANIGKALDGISNPKTRQDVQAVRDAIDFLRKDLMIPPNEVLEDMTMDRLASMYEKHGGTLSRLQYDKEDSDPELAKREALINDLARKRGEIAPAILDQMAEDGAKTLMGLTETGTRYVKEFSALSRDPGTLKKREHVPLPLRKMLGEIEAAPGVILSTLANQAALKARTHVMHELLREHEGTLVMSPEEYSKQDFKGRAKWIPVSGAGWGQLDGYFVHPTVHGHLNETLGTFYTWGEAFSALGRDSSIFASKVLKDALPATTGRANRYSKLLTVVGNPFGWAGNAMGSPLTIIGSGNFRFRAAGEGLATAFDYVRGTAKNTSTPRLEEAIRYLNMEAADVGELQSILGDKMKHYLDGTLDPREADGMIRNAVHSAAEKGSRAVRTTVSAYAILDNWAKVANYYDRKSTLQAMYEAAGEKRTDEQISREAGDDTSYTNLSPERVPNWLKALEARGVSQYAPYFYEVFRTRYTGFAQAAQDVLRANDLKAAGKSEAANIMYAAAAKRFLGHSVATVGIPAAGAVRFAPALAAVGLGAQFAMALSADEEDNEKKRRMISEYNRDQDVLVIGYNDKGMPIYLPFSQRFDPNGPFTDLIRAAVYAEDPETFAKNLMAYGYNDMYIAPRWAIDAWKSVFNSTAPESDISKLFPQIKEIGEKFGMGANAADRVLNVFDSFLPGALKAQKTSNSAQGMVEGGMAPNAVAAAAKKIGVNITPRQVADFINLTGARFETLDPVRTMTSFADKSQDKASENAGAFNRDLLNSTNLTKEKVLDAAVRFRYAELKRQQEDYKNVESLRDGWKMDNAMIAQALEEAGYPKKDYVPMLLAGEGQAIVKLKSFGGYIDSSTRYNDAREKEQRKGKGASAAELLIELEPELNKLGVVLDKKGLSKEYK